MKKLFSHLSIAAAIAVMGITLVSPITHAQAVTNESAIKVKYLANFMMYVDWPKEYVTQNFIVCVLGTNPFGKEMDVLNGQVVKGRSIRVITDVPLAQARYCNMVFVSRSESGRLSGALLNLRQSPILTVSDIDGFADKGGVIEMFSTSDGSIAFRVSQKSAQDVGLQVSSNLMRLSK